jgi:peroxiredoxin
MFAQTLIVAALGLAAPPDAAGPRLEKGLELRWTGTFTEATFRPGVRTLKTFDVETRLLILETGDFGSDGAIATKVSLRPERKPTEPTPPVHRLELIRIDPHGRVQILPSPLDTDHPSPKARPWPGVSLQGLPAHEAGMFVEFPDKPLKPDVVWSREDADRPIVSWKVADSVSFRGQLGHKLVAEQKSEGYYSERVRQPEWRRLDTLTILPANGFASRVERVIERREPDVQDLAFRSVLALELQGRLVLSGRLLEERKDEVVQSAAFAAALDRLMADNGRGGAKTFALLAERITHFVRDNGSGDSVPYREATLAVRARATAAAKGNLPPTPPPDVTTVSASTDPLAVGRLIPDVTAQGVTGPGSVKLSKLQGKPALLVYFQPGTASGPDVLKLAEALHARKLGTVVPLAIGEPADVKRIHAALKLTVPVFDGLGVYKEHGLNATPVFIVIDAAGVIRAVTKGWADDTAATVTRTLEQVSR